MTTPAAEDGWIPLGPSKISPLLLVLTAPAAILLFILANRVIVSLAVILWAGDELWSLILATAVSVVLVGGSVYLFLVLRYPRVSINRRRQLVRSGLRTSAFSDVTLARLVVVSESKKQLSLVVVIESPSGFRGMILVRGPKGQTLSPPQKELVLDVLRGSSIDFLTTAYDPTNKFGRYNFPQNLDKGDTIRLVENPPQPGDKLPIGNDRSWIWSAQAGSGGPSAPARPSKAWPTQAREAKKSPPEL